MTWPVRHPAARRSPTSTRSPSRQTPHLPSGTASRSAWSTTTSTFANPGDKANVALLLPDGGASTTLAPGREVERLHPPRRDQRRHAERGTRRRRGRRREQLVDGVIADPQAPANTSLTATATKDVAPNKAQTFQFHLQICTANCTSNGTWANALGRTRRSATTAPSPGTGEQRAELHVQHRHVLPDPRSPVAASRRRSLHWCAERDHGRDQRVGTVPAPRQQRRSGDRRYVNCGFTNTKVIPRDVNLGAIGNRTAGGTTPPAAGPVDGITFQAYTNTHGTNPVAGATCVTGVPTAGKCTNANLPSPATYYIGETTYHERDVRRDHGSECRGQSRRHAAEAVRTPGRARQRRRRHLRDRALPRPATTSQASRTSAACNVALLFDLSTSIDSTDLGNIKTAANGFVANLDVPRRRSRNTHSGLTRRRPEAATATSRPS